MLLTVEQGIKLLDEIENRKSHLPADIMRLIKGYESQPVYAYIKDNTLHIAGTDTTLFYGPNMDIVEIMGKNNTFIVHDQYRHVTYVYDTYGTGIACISNGSIRKGKYIGLSHDFIAYRVDYAVRVSSHNDMLQFILPTGAEEYEPVPYFNEAEGAWSSYIPNDEDKSISRINSTNQLFILGPAINPPYRIEIRVYNLNLLLGDDQAKYLSDDKLSINSDNTSISITFPLDNWKSYRGIFCDYVVLYTFTSTVLLYRELHVVTTMFIAHPVTKETRYMDMKTSGICIWGDNGSPDLGQFIWVVKDGMDYLLNIRHLAWGVLTLLNLNNTSDLKVPPRLLDRREDDIHIAIGKNIYIANDKGLTFVSRHENQIIAAIF